MVLVALVFIAALTIASVQDQTIQWIGARAPTIKRWGGYVLIAVGIWFFLLAAFAETLAEVFPV